ncbi:MAG TPA: opioid growth factor receptor-related protein [Tepidisphaeraceae bacterium]|jgi:hypothetical protein|nr:opioid growth factor receptor-related protein [Tepidisphaeraceae bacterium]
MSQLLDFYRLQARDSEGRTLEQIWAWSEDELEHCHDFIQWMFPLDEPSAFNSDAPLVTEEEQAAFRSEPQLQAAMRRSFSAFLEFLGLTVSPDGQVVRGENFDRRLSLWKYPNHNWLRITRVLKSLRVLGFEKEAGALWHCLKDLHEKDGFPFTGSFEYWKQAAWSL